MTHDQAIELIVAHRDGKTIQRRFCERWIDIEDWKELLSRLSEEPAEHLRVKPETRTLYVPFHNGIPVVGFYNTDTAKGRYPNADIVEFVEVVN